MTATIYGVAPDTLTPLAAYATKSGAVRAPAAPGVWHPPPRRVPRGLLAALETRWRRPLTRVPAAQDRLRSSVALHYLLALLEAVRVGDLSLKPFSRRGAPGPGGRRLPARLPGHLPGHPPGRTGVRPLRPRRRVPRF